MIAVGAAVFVTLLGSAGLYWAKTSSWLVEHKVLVPADAGPFVSLPGGCGLDLARVVVVVCFVVALVAVAVSAVRHRRQNISPLDQ